MQAERLEIAIWDNGELDDVRQLVSEFGFEFAEGGAKASDGLPTHLLISSGSCSAETLRRIKGEPPTHHFLHLVIVERASRSLINVLEREGCDLVTNAPIHPTALRLVVQRALFSGENKRLVPRVAIGETIKLKTGIWSRSATLAELSVRGCGVITNQQLSIGDQVGLVVPPALTGGGSLKLEGSVVGIKRGLEAEKGRTCAGVVFRNQGRDKSVVVNKIMQRNAVGPTGRLDAEPGSPVAGGVLMGSTAPASGPSALSDVTSGAERRADPRSRYEQPVLARGAGTVHSLIGCDLSTSGMRVSHAEGLCIGERLHLAIYGQKGADPVVTSADVVRLDADSGIGLEFGPLEPNVAARLQQIVDSLPKLDGGDGPAGTVVSEVLASD